MQYGRASMTQACSYKPWQGGSQEATSERLLSDTLFPNSSSGSPWHSMTGLGWIRIQLLPVVTWFDLAAHLNILYERIYEYLDHQGSAH